MSHIKFRKLNKFSIIPSRGSNGAAGFDLHANLSREDMEGFNPEEGLTVCSVASGARQLIAQIIFMPYVGHAVEVHEASETARGDGGFGSTGQ